MSYAHQGPAHVTVSARYFGSDPVDTLNEAVTINLAGSGTPKVARLEFAKSLIGPERANYVRVVLPNGLAMAGSIIQGERGADGSGWLTFGVEEADLGLA
ncbi:hypothetical protein GHO35_13565 [Pseudomonas helleri]|uniref:hypothetical protein n=1 Tax=Pseudomonas helleri TaxID=1608996 RepID=UPI00129582C9|nr:hypothetical protein [Pseudomonas helleri]MQU22168.1 hypothetical protein [Pseudomonas helleri]